MATFDMIIKSGTLVNHMGQGLGDVGITDGKFTAIGDLSTADAGHVIDASGLYVLPGVIDTQVHFREPGMVHKEDLESGARQAVKGGVVGVFEMPNTDPLTTTPEAIQDKVDRAKGRMWCDHAFYMGATAENADHLADIENTPGCCGIKVFMGASTGNLLVADDPTLERVFASGRRRVAIHAEDNMRMDERAHLREEGRPHSHPIWRDDESAIMATRRAVTLARKTNRRVHILHITTPQELAYLAQNKDIASVECTPQHLTLGAPDCYDRLGTYAQMNPPIRSTAHRDGLWEWVKQGVVDVIGSDHAPHLKEEKDRPYPASPSGMPGVQTIVPLLLDHVNKGRLTLQQFVDLTAHGANRLFNLQTKGRMALGYDADITLVDLKKRWTVTADWLEGKSGWSPFEGMALEGKAVGTIIRGQQVMAEDDLLGEAIGTPMRFQETMRGLG
ncbi:MAG: dihydroorotase [Pseudomonadota bacterium]